MARHRKEHTISGSTSPSASTSRTSSPTPRSRRSCSSSAFKNLSNANMPFHRVTSIPVRIMEDVAEGGANRSMEPHAMKRKGLLPTPLRPGIFFVFNVM